VHSWRVRAVNGQTPGSWSAPYTFHDLGAIPTLCAGQELRASSPPGGGGIGGNSTAFFDATVFNPAGITVSQLDTYAYSHAGSIFALEIWTKAGTYRGFEQNASAWTLRALGSSLTTTGFPSSSLVDFPDFTLPPGVSGCAMRIINSSHTYMTGNGANQSFENPDLRLDFGAIQIAMFSSPPIAPQVWNGVFRYNCGGIGTAYCSPAVPNSNGSAATIGAVGSASAGANELTLVATRMPRFQVGFILTSQTQGLVAFPGGSNGTLCLGGEIGRYIGPGFVKQTGLGGEFNVHVDLNRTPMGGLFVAIQPGETWNFQAWFRDVGPPGQPPANFTDGVSVLFH